MKTNLVYAVKHNDLELAKELITKGADVNQKDSSGNSLLIVSSADGNAEIVQLLLESGAALSAVDANMKATALHAAAYLGHPEVMKLLIKQGIDLNIQGPYNGYTALHDAVLRNNTEGVKILVESGANVNLKGHDGNTPSMLAKRQGNSEISEIFNQSIVS
ncbi:MAG: ankyrin repeat domain-containing protein [Pleurocapsa sp. MO_226.B13]|nr:ankyrin repeat domain-containing protein [Pleurocapsa sp. MO_226.B13]